MCGIREPTLHISKKLLSATEILLDRSERKEYGILNNTKEGSMGKLEGTIKDEIIRLAKREMRMKFVPLHRDVRSLKITAS